MILNQDTPPKGTIRDWLDARAQSNKPAFVFPEGEETLNWQDLKNDASRIAKYLTSHGCQKGESIAIMHGNGRDAIRALYGTLYGGFRATMINLAAGPAAISFALDHSDARIAFVQKGANELFNKTKPHNLTAIDLNKPASNTDLHDLSPNDHAILMYTSGTTGRPKGVIHSHASLLAGGWTTAIAHQLTPKDRGFCVLPIYHINGLCVSVMGALVSGGSLAMVPKFSSNHFWQHLGQSQSTWFSVVPTIISHLIHSTHKPDAQTKANLRFGRSASSALAIDVQKTFEQRFDVPIIETMGLTETAAQILSNPLPPNIRKIGSPGIAFGNKVTILDPEQAPCKPGIEGEIAVRGPNIMLEYLKNHKATAQAFTQNWFRTGDLGKIDQDGYIFVTGRLKELIIKGGENIAPREIDEALYSHPDVIEAAAFARANSRYGESVEAAVRLRPGSKISPQDLCNLCIEKVGAFKSPDKIHLFKELPKGPSGKIQRLKLADLTAQPALNNI